MANICVFCSSSRNIPEIYKPAAEELGKLLGERGYQLVYGGSNLGLMGRVARSAQAAGGRVIGVLPEKLAHLRDGEDELILTKDLRERKAIMEAKSDAFIALPGGPGTLDEIADVISHKQLKYHSKPMILINTNNFYSDLIKCFQRMYSQGFIEGKRQLYHIVDTPSEGVSLVHQEMILFSKNF